MSSVYGQTLLDDMVQTQGLPMPLVREAAKEILEVIREGLVRDGVVNVSNFGTFRLKLAAARNGFNPQTRERITIPAHQRVIFSPCKALRELIQPVHKAPIPIPSENPDARAAAMSAPIAPSAAVATKRIVPPTQAPDEAEITSSSTTTVQTERRVTPDRRHANEEVTAEAGEQPTLAEQGADETSNQIDEIRLELGEKNSTTGGSKKGLYFGAAALIVIAAVTASLMYDPSTDEVPNAVVLTAPVTPTPEATSLVAEPPHVKAPPVTPSAEIPTETTTIAEATPPEEVDYSTLYTEMANAQPEAAPAPKTFVSESTPTQTAPQRQTAEVATERAASPLTEPATTTTSKPTTFFFTEQTHEIANGESLWRLARSHYQDPLLWPHIYQANAALITNPDNLRTGRTIAIPSLQGAPGKLTKTDRRNVAEGYYLTYLYYKQTGHKDAFFALLEAKRYDNKVVEEHRSLLKLSKVEEIMLGQQETMPF